LSETAAPPIDQLFRAMVEVGASILIVNAAHIVAFTEVPGP